MGMVGLLGRILLALIFVFSGLDKIGTFNAKQQYMAQHGIPYTPLFLIGAILVEVIGGLSVLVGYRARVGATALALFMIPTTLIFHAHLGDQIQMIMFMKNLSITGGLLMVVANGSGRFSLDQRYVTP
ncbi:MAG TPA: DoxX family protein [Candidatus Kryptonia bacterium]|nr:DoxX family protein [Candidatus Kryptonia bacterium]